MEILNNKLKKLYSDLYPNLSKEIDKLNSKLEKENKKQERATNPLLLKVDNKYANADTKIMFFGQETNYWLSEQNSGAFLGKIEPVLDLYEHFYLKNNCFSYGGHFWNGIKRLKDILKKNFPDNNISYIWNNIIKIGICKKSEKGFPHSVNNITNNYFNVIQKEIEILQPDILIFFSGPNYDIHLETILTKYEKEEIKPFRERELCKIISNNINLSFRTYHPNHLWRNNIDNFFNAIVDAVSNKILKNGDNFFYYQGTSIDKEILFKHKQSEKNIYFDKNSGKKFPVSDLLKFIGAENIKINKEWQGTSNITDLEINNFKIFDSFDIKLSKNINILLGNNGLGKTTILQAITLGLLPFENNDYPDNFYDYIRFNEKKSEIIINWGKNEQRKLYIFPKGHPEDEEPIYPPKQLLLSYGVNLNTNKEQDHTKIVTELINGKSELYFTKSIFEDNYSKLHDPITILNLLFQQRKAKGMEEVAFAAKLQLKHNNKQNILVKNWEKTQQTKFENTNKINETIDIEINEIINKMPNEDIKDNDNKIKKYDDILQSLSNLKNNKTNIQVELQFLQKNYSNILSENKRFHIEIKNLLTLKKDLENEIKEVDKKINNLKDTYPEIELQYASKINDIERLLIDTLNKYLGLLSKSEQIKIVFNDTEQRHYFADINYSKLEIQHLSEGYKDHVLLLTDILVRILAVRNIIFNDNENLAINNNLLKKSKAVILIDEFDRHLHPIWQRKLLSQFKEDFPNIQFILTTHNAMSILDRESDEIIQLETDENKKVIANVHSGNTKYTDISLIYLKYFANEIVSTELKNDLENYNKLFLENKKDTTEFKNLQLKLKKANVGYYVNDLRYWKFLDFLKKFPEKDPIKNNENAGDWDFTDKEWDILMEELNN